VLEQVDFAGHGGARLRGRISRPDGSAGGRVERGVIVVHGKTGLDPRMSALVERCSAADLFAMAPDLWSREGHPRRAEELPDRRALADLDAAALWLAAETGLGPRSIGVLGCGPGGTLAFQLGCTSRNLGALAAIEAEPVHAALDPLRPIQPLELALNLDVAAFFAFLGEASAVPETHVARLRATLSSAAKDFEIARASSLEQALELALAFLCERL
jgi:dienelactone hydrolase